MSESNLTNNEMAERQAAKKPFFKIIILFLFLIILAIFLYFFKDTFLSIINKKIDTKDTSTEVSEKDSPFGNLVSDLNIEPEVKEPKYYIDLYNEYKMGEMGLRYEFRGLDEENMSLKLIDKTEEGNVEKTFPLYKDFLIVCTEFDISRYGLDFRYLTDSDKYNIAMKSSSMSLTDRLNLISSYPIGTTFSIVFNDYTDLENLQVKKILLTNSDPNSCYFNEK